MLTQLRIKQLYFLLESVAIKGIPVSKSSHYTEILKLTREILETFGMSRIKKYESLLIQYIYNSEYTENFMDDVLIYLSKMADKTLTGDIGDFLPSKNSSLPAIEDELNDIDPKEFEREAEAEWQEIEEQREKRMTALRSLPRTVEPDAVKQYITTHLDIAIADKELKDILTGFQLFWKYSNPQQAGDLNFQWAVDQYLTSVDSPQDRKKVEKVVDSILEYLQEVRLWGYPQ
ncbi:MAG: hypothetical protein NTU98_07995 [Bacteroidetes bacterium]|nr:hypothetical protein [Bacteroidota bacterium]